MNEENANGMAAFGKIFPSPFAPVTFPIEPRDAPASVAIANSKFSISNSQFRREFCGDAVLVAACRAALLCGQSTFGCGLPRCALLRLIQLPELR
jgi:hypothetical protein